MEQQTQQSLPAEIEAILQPQATPEVLPNGQAVEPAPVAAQPPAPQPEPPKADPTVPLSVLLDERHRFQERVGAQEAELRAIKQYLEAQARPAPPPLDPVADPEGFARAMVQETANLRQAQNEQALHQRANMSEMLARRDHGDQVVDEAIKAAHQAGLGKHFMTQPDPYRALMSWKNSQAVASEVGTDLKAYREKVRQEILAEIKGQLKPGAAPQVLPPSLSSATRANTASPVVQDSSDFFRNTLFAKPQPNNGPQRP